MTNLTGPTRRSRKRCQCGGIQDNGRTADGRKARLCRNCYAVTEYHYTPSAAQTAAARATRDRNSETMRRVLAGDI